MFCQACGADNKGDARFCNMCGTAIAKPGTPGGMVANGTVKGTGEPPPVRAEAPIVAPAPSAVHGPARAGPPIAHAAAGEGVWDQAGASMAGRSYGGGSAGISGIGNATLAGVGVQSSRRAWTVILIIAVLLVGFGALAGWGLSGGEPEPEDYDPEVAENQAEIGLPLPEGVDLPEEAIFDGVTGGGTPAPSTMMGGGGATSMAGGNDEDEAPTTTVIGSSMGTSTAVTSMDSTGTAMSGTSGTGGTSGTMSATDDSSSMETVSDMSTGSMSSTTTTGTVPDDAPEERDIEMSMYSQRVRYVIARYYASRAQTCFDLATRNTPSLSGEVRIRLTIRADGQVTNASPVANTTGNETLGQCLAGRVQQWQLPPPPGGELTLVLPFRN
jgi:TonB family protein